MLSVRSNFAEQQKPRLGRGILFGFSDSEGESLAVSERLTSGHSPIGHPHQVEAIAVTWYKYANSDFGWEATLPAIARYFLMSRHRLASGQALPVASPGFLNSPF